MAATEADLGRAQITTLLPLVDAISEATGKYQLAGSLDFAKDLLSAEATNGLNRVQKRESPDGHEYLTGEHEGSHFFTLNILEALVPTGVNIQPNNIGREGPTIYRTDMDSIYIEGGRYGDLFTLRVFAATPEWIEANVSASWQLIIPEQAPAYQEGPYVHAPAA